MTQTRHAAGFHYGASAMVRRVGHARPRPTHVLHAHAAPGHAPLHAGASDVEVFTYTFENFFQPFVGELIARLNRTSVAGMLDPAFLEGLSDGSFFQATYHPVESASVHILAHPKEIDVAPGGAYSDYNWELLYHIPVAIAVHLGKSQRFAEAQRWFHYVFDPTATGPGPASERCWKFIGFRGEHATSLDDLLALLGTPDVELTPEQSKRKEWVHRSYEAILSSPFHPHLVARARPVAYQYYVVMKYLDNLIAWGDSLFSQYTIETINEAMVSYVLAANLLGPRPQRVPTPVKPAAKSFAQIKKAGLDELAKALIDLEARLPLDNTLPAPPRRGASPDENGPLFGIGQTAYFCVPRNQKLLAYWDTVADRLFKIRNCMDITGVVRPLPLFDPPIDPGMLVKAAAAGLDASGIVSGMSQPIGPLRSFGQIQKALELCGEVKALGNALLSACEKGDGEQMALLRQGHEVALQKLTKDVRFLQWKQAEEATESLLRSRATTLQRYRYYLRLLGQTPDETAPDKLPLDRRELTEENFDDAYSALVGEYDKAVTTEPFSSMRWAGGAAPSTQAGASGKGQLYLSSGEGSELDRMTAAAALHVVGGTLQTLAAAFRPIPGLQADASFWGLGVNMDVFSGMSLSKVIEIGAAGVQTAATAMQDAGSMAARTASYERRADEWRLQVNTAAHELTQMGRQILSSLIMEQVARHEHQTAETQVKHAEEVDALLRSKFTSAELYGWMQGELSRLYYQYYRFALDVARKAELTMKRELMRPELDATSFVQPSYWDAGRKGLLSGEALHLDLKRLEMAYHDNDKRELELTRHVSLRQLDPMALLQLKVTGACTVSIPEWLYDRDCPGHYLRRIKTVALSIPSVVGPYTSVNCTLTLQKSTVRVTPTLANGSYARDTDDPDDRFVDYLGSVDSVVTSGGANDSGMFETNLRDDRFLPFEGAGAVSTWGLSLPSALRAFDYMTISDVILHVRYTARNGGGALGAQATKELQQALADASQAGLALLFSLRHDFPTEWTAFVRGAGDFAFALRKSFFPYMAQGGQVTVDNLVAVGQAAGAVVQATVPVPDGLGDGLNGASGAAALTVPADGQALVRDAGAQVFLIVQYHLGS